MSLKLNIELDRVMREYHPDDIAEVLGVGTDTMCWLDELSASRGQQDCKHGNTYRVDPLPIGDHLVSGAMICPGIYCSVCGIKVSN